MRVERLSTLCIVFALAASSGRSFASDAPPQNGALFIQPELNGVSGNFHVPKVEKKYPTERLFNVILWQPNPNTTNGELIPTAWPVGDMTGFYPAAPVREHQAAFRDAVGASAVQIDGGTIGAYLNSRDLLGNSSAHKMMITPAFVPAKGQRVHPFAEPSEAIVTSLELQVPTARDLNRPGNYTYVSTVLMFEDSNSNTRISYGANFFHHGLAPPPALNVERLKDTEVGPYDTSTKSYQIGNPVAADSQILTIFPRSSAWQTQPWLGWKSFEFAITTRNFEEAIRALEEQKSGFGGSENPADYTLVEWHLNAELIFATGPAELGWSMRRARCTLVGRDTLKSLEGH